MTVKVKKAVQGVQKQLRHVSSRTYTIVGVLAFAAIGTILLVSSHAATPTASFQAEAGTRASGANVVSDSTASGSSAVKFTSATTSGSCISGALNDPGTADPWGGCWPGPQNTGYPHGVLGDTRTPVTLSTTIPDNATSGTGWSWVWYDSSHTSGYVNIDSCSPTKPIVFDKTLIKGTVWIQGGKNTGYHTEDHPCVKITNSKITGIIYTDSPDDGPILVTDTDVDSGTDKEQFANVGYYNIYAYRVNSYRGEMVIKCSGWCTFKDNWAHAGVVEPASHANAIGTNGLYSPLGVQWVVEHNYASCGDWASGDDSDSGGCSGDISLFPNFANIHDVYIHRNYLTAARAYTGSPAATQISNPWHYWSQPAYCIYTGNDDDDNDYRAQNVIIDDNVFGKGVGVSNKCGVYGPVANWAGAVRGNQFTNNKYDDGTPVPSN